MNFNDLEQRLHRIEQQMQMLRRRLPVVVIFGGLIIASVAAVLVWILLK